MNRPRGLCWSCYYTPGVKELHPITSKYATHAHRGLAELDEADIDALTLELDAPLVTPPEVRPVFAAVQLEWSRTRTDYLLTDDTGPDAIADRQRREVADYLAAHPTATPEEAGAALVLPVWSVLLRLAEARGEPAPYTSLKRRME